MEHFLTFFYGTVLGFVLGACWIAYGPTEELKDTIICEYLGGEVHDTICVKNGVVISTRK